MPKQPVLYEAMYILDTRIEEEQRQEAVEALEAHVVAQGGELIATRDFGRRRLAYEIEGHLEGFYKILYFKSFGDCVEEVKHEMRLLPQVVRGSVFVVNPKAIFDPAGDAKAAEEAAAAAAAAAAPAEAETDAVEAPETDAVEAPEAEAVAPEAEAVAEAPAAAEAPAESAESSEA